VIVKLISVFIVSYVLFFSVEFGMRVEREVKANCRRTVCYIIAIIMSCYLAGVAADKFLSLPQLLQRFPIPN
jgi:uncharacterized membrane protein